MRLRPAILDSSTKDLSPLHLTTPIVLLSISTLLCACNSSPAPFLKPPQPTSTRPTIPPPPIKLFHQDNDTYTLTTLPNATDEQIEAILYQLRDAARAKTFDTLHLSQAFVDARKPTVWFHIYRGPKCASEKYTKGPLPCDASYHGAGDYTLGTPNNLLWDSAILHLANGKETQLWDPDAH